MSDLRFDNKVVVITGAGRGLGKAYALFYGSVGAKVLVNDNGCDLDGKNTNPKFADEVVATIKSKGGIAVANYDSVLNGDKIIAHAIKEFGRLDVLINNAGILRDKILAKLTEEDWDIVIKTHLYGTYSVTKAAWPIMRDQGFGRIVNTSSGSGLYGTLGQTNYAAAKAGIVGLTLTLAKEGERRNILCNVLVPVGASRMTETIMPPDVMSGIDPNNLTPILAVLTHESNKEYNGGIYECSGGFFSRVRWQRSEGVSLDLPVKISEVQKNWAKINDFNGKNEYPTGNADLFNKVQENLERLEQQAAQKPKL
ncbi:unnamed protein product [Paramecium pentaurelia]|uniref:Ketoreductase domain-containing protein n=1 Tax=Paramecium pentaurelia TaxID=43138 RepID=A0A8S1UPK3_9CILI|nr:unnamed protein product [Paramecium pentaurelia]